MFLSLPLFYLIICLSIFLAICGTFLCLVCSASFPRQPPAHKEALRRAKVLPPSAVSFELLFLRISLHFGLGFRRLQELLSLFLFFNILQWSLGCYSMVSVRGIEETKTRTSDKQVFVQMEPPHWACGGDKDTCSMGRREKTGWKGIGSGRKSFPNHQAYSLSGLPQTPAAS